MACSHADGTVAQFGGVIKVVAADEAEKKGGKDHRANVLPGYASVALSGPGVSVFMVRVSNLGQNRLSEGMERELTRC